MTIKRVRLNGVDNGPGDRYEVYLLVDLNESTNIGTVTDIRCDNDSLRRPHVTLRRRADGDGAQRIYSADFTAGRGDDTLRTESIPVSIKVAERVRLTYDPVRDRFNGLDGEVLD